MNKFVILMVGHGIFKYFCSLLHVFLMAYCLNFGSVAQVMDFGF